MYDNDSSCGATSCNNTTRLTDSWKKCCYSAARSSTSVRVGFLVMLLKFFLSGSMMSRAVLSKNSSRACSQTLRRKQYESLILDARITTNSCLVAAGEVFK